MFTRFAVNLCARKVIREIRLATIVSGWRWCSSGGKTDKSTFFLPKKGHYTNADESMLLWLVRQVVAHAEYKPGVTLIASDDNVSGLLQKSVNELLRRDDEEAFVIPEAVLKGRRK